MNALLLTGMLFCQGLDFGTTYAALHSGRFIEGNAAMRGPHLYTAKVAVNVGMLIWRQKAAKDSPAKKVIPLVMAAGGCSAGLWNVHQLRAR